MDEVSWDILFVYWRNLLHQVRSISLLIFTFSRIGPIGRLLPGGLRAGASSGGLRMKNRNNRKNKII